MTSSSDNRSLHTHIGKAIQFKGEISGEEDVLIDGTVTGSIHLKNQSVTIGRSGSVTADVTARTLVVKGTLQGQVIIQDRAEIEATGSLVGDLSAGRIAIQDGAFCKGKLEVVRQREETGAEKLVDPVAPRTPSIGPSPELSNRRDGSPSNGELSSLRPSLLTGS